MSHVISIEADGLQVKTRVCRKEMQHSCPHMARRTDGRRKWLRDQPVPCGDSTHGLDGNRSTNERESSSAMN
jgi:hypothetical protein